MFWTEVMNAHQMNLEERMRVFGWEPEAIAALQMEVQETENESGLNWFEKHGWWNQNTLRILPYPGGRHPRIGFLDGALKPQRETKVSVFTPWDPSSYVVVDVPEAIWSNLGLTYLAHQHIDTLWDAQGIQLEQKEWELCAGGVLRLDRTLPNGIRFLTRITPVRDAILMEIELTNGANTPLSGLVTQNCVMLKGMQDMNQQTLENKKFFGPYAACSNPEGNRWVITAWEPLNRTWGEPRCPCLHSDPVFPDCDPGETVRIRGWLSFHEGGDIKQEIERIDKSGWRHFKESPMVNSLDDNDAPVEQADSSSF